MSVADTNSRPIAIHTGPAGLGDSNVIHSNLLTPLLSAGGDNGSHLPPALTGTPTFSGLLQALRRRWPFAVVLAVLASASAVFFVLTVMPAKYPAQVRLHIASRGDARVFGETGDEPDFTVYKANLAAMIKTQAVLDAALTQKTSTGKEVKDIDLVREEGLDWIEPALKTDFLLGPETLKVVLNSDRPDEGAELLNAMARAFVDFHFKQENDRRLRRINDLKENLKKQEQDLSSLRLKLQKREDFYKVPDEKVRLTQHTAAYQNQQKAGEAVIVNRTEQIKAREDLASMQERLKRIDETPIVEESLDEIFRKDERTQTILLEVRKIEKDILEMKANGREPYIGPQLHYLEQRKHEIVQRLAALKNELRPEFESAWRGKYASDLQIKMLSARDQLTALQKQEPALRDELRKAEEAAKELAPGVQLPLEIVEMRGKILNLDSSVSDIVRAIQKLVADNINPRVTIEQLAGQPKGKDYSRQTKIAGAGGLGIFMLVLFGVALSEFRVRRISGADEVSHGLGLHVVGALPPLPLSARSLGADGAGSQNGSSFNQLNEAIDGIRTMLLHASRAENLRVIMVTSAAGGEGKTTLATQLAASLARAWRKTLLIDGDLRQPAAHKVFNIPQEPGFSELLRNEVSLADTVKPTALGRLWLMPAGHCDSHAVEALAQDSVRTLLEELKQQYDFIIVDSAPVLPVADSLLLGQHVDGVIFSILRDVSRAPAIYAAQQKINRLAIRTLGAVMIGAKSETGNPLYAYTGSNGKTS